MKIFSLGIACILLAGCSPSQPRNSGVYMLIDTSGTYREEMQKAEQIIRYTLSRLDATDSMAVARVDTGSFSEKDIVAKMQKSLLMTDRARLTDRNAFLRSRSKPL